MWYIAPSEIDVYEIELHWWLNKLGQLFPSELLNCTLIGSTCFGCLTTRNNDSTCLEAIGGLGPMVTLKCLISWKLMFGKAWRRLKAKERLNCMCSRIIYICSTFLVDFHKIWFIWIWNVCNERASDIDTTAGMFRQKYGHFVRKCLISQFLKLVDPQ